MEIKEAQWLLDHDLFIRVTSWNILREQFERGWTQALTASYQLHDEPTTSLGIALHCAGSNECIRFLWGSD